MRACRLPILFALMVAIVSCADQSRTLFEGEWVSHGDPEHPTHAGVLSFERNSFSLSDEWDGKKVKGLPIRGLWVYKDDYLVLTVKQSKSCKVSKGSEIRFKVGEVSEKTLRIIEEDQAFHLETTYTKRP